MMKRSKLTAVTNDVLARVSGGISVPALDAIDQIVERLNDSFHKRPGHSGLLSYPSDRAIPGQRR